MSEQPSEVQNAFSESLRSAIAVGTQAAELYATTRETRAREAQARSDAERAAYAERLKAERDGAMPIMRQPWDPRWWSRADSDEIGHVWQITSGWAAGGDPYARTTLDQMRRQISRRFGIEAPDPQQSGSEVAAVLATPTQSKTVEAQTEAIAADAEPSFPPADEHRFSYVLRDANDPTSIVAQGVLSADSAAEAADVAVHGLREFARDSALFAQTPEDRFARFMDAGFQRQRPARDISTLAIDVYPEGQTEGTPLYSLTGSQVDQVRAERRAQRQAVISGEAKASDAEILAAIRLEHRAAREELRDREGDLHRASLSSESEAATAAAEAVGQTRERLADLDLRRRVSEANLRGEDGQAVMQAQALRETLDSGWWETASDAEIAGVWEHVEGWPDGAGKTAGIEQLRDGIRRTHGLDVSPTASGDQVAAILNTAHGESAEQQGPEAGQDALRQRARQEQAATTTSAETAEGLAEAGEPGGDVRAEAGNAEEMAEAAQQDSAAAAALSNVDDREAAEAVALAAEDFAGGTPATRLANRPARGARSQRSRTARQARSAQKGREGR